MRQRNPLPSYERVRELFDYEPDTGILRWKVKRAQMDPGDAAGGFNSDNGYIQVSVDRKLYRAHLLAWLWMTGVEPVSQIDHRDTNRSNNRWDNLREATQSQNMGNMSLPKHNSSGLKGVSPYRAGVSYGKPWQASIRKNGRSVHLGHFATKHEAHAAYATAAERIFGEFARVA